jgi:SNF2 family DNA or RNA helicase
MEDYREIYNSVVLLSKLCDYASTVDGQGFNKYDTDFGHSLAERPFERWTARQLKAAWKLIRKYKGQLKNYGIDFDSIPEPPEIIQPIEVRTITLKDNYFVVSFPDNDYDAQAKIRTIGRWQKSEGYIVNRVGALCQTLKDFARVYRYELGEGVQEALDACVAQANQTYQASKAADTDFDVPGLNLPLRPFQRASVKFLLDTKKTILGDEMGLGKTPTIIATAKAANLYPIIVFAPKAVKINWSNEFKKFDPAITDEDIIILRGRIKLPEANQLRELIDLHQRILKEKGTTDAKELRGGTSDEESWLNRSFNRFGSKIDPDIMNLHGSDFATRFEQYQGLKKQFAESSKIVTAKVIIINPDIGKAWLPVLKALPKKCVVCDECHAVKNGTSARSKVVKELAEGVEYVYLLSGSPLLNRPSEFVSYLDILGVLQTEWGGWKKFVTTFCAAYQGPWGWVTTGASNEQELNRRLRSTRYIRRIKKDRYDREGNLLEKGVAQDELPEKQVSTIVVELTNQKEYDKAEDDLITSIWNHAYEEKKFLDSIKLLPKEEYQKARHEWANSKAEKAERAEHLARINHLRQIAARGKIEAFKELVESYDDAEQGFVAFGWHKDIVTEMGKIAGCPIITGDTSEEKRAQYVDSFQAGKIQRMALNMAAGGVGITLTGPPTNPCSDAIFTELDWRPPILTQAEDRIFRIGTKSNGVNIYYILAKGTIDEEMWELLSSKRKVIDESVEGSEGDPGVDIVSGIMGWLKKKGEKKYGKKS